MLRLLTALLAGLFLGGLGLELFTETVGIGWVWPAVLPFLILSATLTMIGKAMRGVAPSLKPAATAQLLAQNLGAVARVTGVKRTGTTVNESPLCELTVIVAPTGTDAFTTTLRMLVDPVELPRYQPGAIVTVVRIKPGSRAVALVREPGEQWRRRMAAEADRIPVSAPRADDDTEATSGSRPIVGIGPRGRGLRVAAYVALLAVGSGIVVVSNYGGVVDAIEAARVGDDYDDFVNGDRQPEAVAALAEVIGGTEVVKLTFHADSDYSGFVTAEAPSEPGAATIDAYMYRDGTADRQEHPPTQPEEPRRLLFDLAGIDVSLVGELAREARELTGISDPESETVGLGRETVSSADTATRNAAGEPRFDVFVSDRYYNGSVGFGLDGEVLSMTGGAPGSKADESGR